MKFKSPTGSDIQINLDSGHSATVFANEWTELMPMFHREALMRGAITDNMSEEAIAGAALQSASVSPDRKEMVLAALREMIADKDKDEFTQSGQPKIGALRERLGIGIEREEMMAAWAELVEAGDA